MLSPRTSATLSSPDEVCADDECLREALRPGLDGVLDRIPHWRRPRAVAERRLVVGRGDDQHLSDPCRISVDSG